MGKFIKIMVILNTFLVFFLGTYIAANSWFTAGIEILDDLPMFGKVTNQLVGYSAIIKLGDVDGNKFCSAFVIDKRYALTAGHCIDNRGSLRDDIIRIYNAGGAYTGIEATAAGLNNRVDVGLIKGNFSKFKRLKVEFYRFTAYGFHDTSNPRFMSCGFPYLQKFVTCIKFVPKTNYFFNISGQGFALPGMSGGPVIDLQTNKVIGVTSAMGDGHFLVAPTLGALGAFGIEPDWKNK